MSYVAEGVRYLCQELHTLLEVVVPLSDGLLTSEDREARDRHRAGAVGGIGAICHSGSAGAASDAGEAGAFGFASDPVVCSTTGCGARASLASLGSAGGRSVGVGMAAAGWAWPNARALVAKHSSCLASRHLWPFVFLGSSRPGQ